MNPKQVARKKQGLQVMEATTLVNMAFLLIAQVQ